MKAKRRMKELKKTSESEGRRHPIGAGPKVFLIGFHKVYWGLLGGSRFLFLLENEHEEQEVFAWMD